MTERHVRASLVDTTVVLRHSHTEGEIPDYHEPVWLGDTTYRDKTGRPHKQGRTLFAHVRCNNPGCEFEALVDAVAVVAVVVAALGTADVLKQVSASHG